ncbi:MAG: T9SS type A sorting domain-containing protein, partial [Bacteroidota bacterium]
GALDKKGEPKWITSMGGLLLDGARTCQFDTNGQLWIGGTFQRRLEFFNDINNDHSLLSKGAHDGFIAGYDSKGQLISTYHLGGHGWDFIHDITINNDQLHVVGYFSKKIDFSKDGVTKDKRKALASDVFVQCLSISEFTEHSVEDNIAIAKENKNEPFTPKPELALFPNPAINSFTVEFPFTFDLLKVKILNSTGALVREEEFREHSLFEMNVQGLPAGIYIVNMTLDGIEKSTELVIQP